MQIREINNENPRNLYVFKMSGATTGPMLPTENLFVLRAGASKLTVNENQL